MLLRNSICFRYAQTRYISHYARNSICCLRQRVSIAPFLLAPQGISSVLAPYRVADISSDASAAHIDVESSCETHDRLDVGQDYKRSQNLSKKGVETPKGIFLKQTSFFIHHINNVLQTIFGVQILCFTILNTDNIIEICIHINPI